MPSYIKTVPLGGYMDQLYLLETSYTHYMFDQCISLKAQIWSIKVDFISIVLTHWLNSLFVLFQGFRTYNSLSQKRQPVRAV